LPSFELTIGARVFLKKILAYFETEFDGFSRLNKNESIFVSGICYKLTAFNLNNLLVCSKNLIPLATPTQLNAILNYHIFIL